MIIGFILTTIIALFFWVLNPRQASSRWAGLAFFTAGAGFLETSLRDVYIPYGITHHLQPYWIIHLLNLIAATSAFATVVIYPFCYTLYALHYCGLLSRRMVSQLSLVLVLPVLLSLIKPTLLNNIVVLTWVAPYILFSSFQ
jgi:hypothetical protein